ncbi:MAG TPA: NADPH-dependent glutamate synthase [Phycisphaerae bacterium]|nr:NADPH-dependent glutamate synthase [Phycisphaerae bacterium]HPM24710.1 NADPH-dependent glutamate synthase [Phycisphaerae bacterium]
MALTPKERMAIERQQMPERAPDVRNRDFKEVNLGFREELARLEASRCLQCKDSKCVIGCPVGIDIPGFLDRVVAGDLKGAAELLLSANALPGITGRVCPQEEQCEQVCIRAKGKNGKPVAVGHLERFVADWARENLDMKTLLAKPTGIKIAIVGSGPAGLTAAGELAKKGHDVTVFEALHNPGGVLLYGIPEFRLPKKIIAAEVNRLREMGVKIVCNVVVGRTFTIHELLNEEGFSAIFIANGAGLPVFMNVPGENLKGVYSANEYLTRSNLMRAYEFPEYDTPIIRAERVVVVGGGNVAMDSVRTAKRLGAKEATLVYRRSRAEMPARVEEVHHAEEEGIIFKLLCNPTRVLGTSDGWVKGIECIRMELGEPDESGRRRPVPVKGSEFVIDCDVVIPAIGTRANPLLTSATPELKLNKWGYIIADESGATSMPGVYAGGDIVRGAATVILAMGDGKKSAAAIDQYVRAKHNLPPAVAPSPL